MTADGAVKHEGYLVPDKGQVSTYNPGWGYNPASDDHTSLTPQRGQNISLQSLGGKLWINWEDKSQWAPEKSRRISWWFAEIEPSNSGWSLAWQLRPPSPILARTNSSFLCYRADICLFTGASIAGRGKKMSPGIRFSPESKTTYTLANKKKRSHSGWDSGTMFSLFNENLSLYGSIGVSTAEAGTPSPWVIAVAIAQQRERQGRVRYDLITSSFKGLSAPGESLFLRRSDNPMRHPAVVTQGSDRVVAFEHALPEGGIQIELCHWKEGENK
ncbi:hypothetical protein [Aestuariirhabdus sp. LZHN29]|uniref:hypothetical protein n=1 Tax=Aestuariirhabdus sp. LZHN29 TaxID=3417462 RepID=UPI003CEF1968